MIKLFLPVRDVYVTQPFGVNYVNFYQALGLKAHNGIDFKAFNGFNLYASTSGVVTIAGVQADGGIEVEIWDATQGVKTIYYHLKDINGSDGQPLKVGQRVSAGEIIGHCDNTGKYTTGDHLHFGLKQVDSHGNTVNYDNGYRGAIDPSPYFCFTYNGRATKNSDWQKSNAYHRYLRTDRYILKEIQVRAVLTVYLRRVATNEEVNACVYGWWDREALKNDAMYLNWAYKTKIEIQSGKKPFQD